MGAILAKIQRVKRSIVSLTIVSIILLISTLTFAVLYFRERNERLVGS